MVHILLLILKIIGIIVLSILGLALLILFFPITYVGKVNGNIEEKKITGNIRAGWLFHLLHCRLWIENTEIHYNIRLLGIKIKSSETKEKKKKEKRETKIWIYFGLFWSSWSSEFMSVSLLVTRYTRI